MRYANTDHQQVPVVLKSADVDPEMIDILRWMNSFSEVLTIASCQEDPPLDGAISRPYVLWTSFRTLETARILEEIGGRTTVTYDSYRGTIVYRTSWPNIAEVRRNVTRLKQIGEIKEEKPKRRRTPKISHEAANPL
jgi:hypothetical protein